MSGARSLLIACALVSLPCALAAEESPPKDAAALHVDAPRGAKVFLEGKDQGAKRDFKFSSLQPGVTYAQDLRVILPGGGEVKRRVLLRGGWQINLPIRSADAARPEVVMQTGHSGSPRSGALSPDGRYVLTGGYDGDVLLWDASTGRQLRSYPGSKGSVCFVAFVGNGQQVLHVSHNGGAVRLDRDTGRVLLTIPSATAVFCAAVSPDGRSLCTGHYHSAESPEPVVLWDVETGRKLRVLRGHTQTVHAVGFSTDGRRVLSGDEGAAFLFDVNTGQRLQRFEMTLPTRIVAFSPDGKRALTAAGKLAYKRTGTAGELAIWELASGLRVAKRSLEQFVLEASFTPEGAIVASLSPADEDVQDDNQRAIHHYFDGMSLAPIDRPVAAPTRGKILFSPDRASVFDGKTLWDRKTTTPRAEFQSRQADLFGFGLNSETSQILLRAHYVVAQLDLRTGAAIHTYPIPKGKWGSHALLSDDASTIVLIVGEWLAIENPKTPYEAIVYDAQSGKELRRFAVTKRSPREASLSSDGKTLFVVSANQRAATWETATGKQLRTFLGESDDNRTLGAVEDAAKSVFGLKETPGNAWRGSLSRDGHSVLIYSIGHDHDAVSWDRETGKKLVGFPEQEGEYRRGGREFLTWDGRRVATAGPYEKDDKIVSSFKLWDAGTGRMVRAFGGHTKDVQQIAFSRDGRLLLSRSEDGITHLWDAETGVQLRTFFGHSHTFVHPQLTADGRWVVTASADGVVRFTDVATGDEVVRLIGMGQGNDWFALTPEGLFDGSEEARRHVAFRVGGGLNIVPVDRFFQDFYRPGLLAASLGRNERTLPETAVGEVRPPVLRIVSPKTGVVESNSVTLEVEAADQGGGVQGPWLVHNGARLLTTGKAERTGNIVRRRMVVSLIEGENRLEVRSASGDGAWESEPAVLVLRYEQPLVKPSLYVLSVGVNRYAQERMNLKFAAADAKAIADLFQQRGKTLYRDVVITRLVDDKATKAAIGGSLQEFAKQARPQDTLVVFLAGHGTMVGQRYYFIPHEFQQQADKLEDDVRKQAIAADVLADLVGAVPALKRMLVFDTCQSGGALSLKRGGRDPFAFRGAIERLSRSQGVFTLAAAASGEEAQEVDDLGHGVLTYALLAALQAAPSGPLEGQSVRPNSPDQVADVLEWFGYASAHVPRLTKKYFGKEQDVQTSGQGTSFPVLPIRD